MALPAFRTSVVDPGNRPRMGVRCTGGPNATRVAEVLKRVSLGPAYPLQEYLDVIVGETGERLGTKAGVPVAIALATQVRDRHHGGLIEIVFRDTLLAFPDDRRIVSAFVQLLRNVIVHELDEAVRLDGKLFDDTHANEVVPVVVTTVITRNEA